MPSARLAYNPTAGGFPSWLLTERAAQVLRAHGWEIDMVQSRSGEHLTEISAQAVQEGMDALIVVGGDGSVNYAVRALIGTQTALGVLPAGTANIWAREIGLIGLRWTRLFALEESARRLVGGRVQLVDVGYCNEKPFLLWAGVGLDGFLVHRIEPRKSWEKRLSVIHYTAATVWNVSYWHGIRMRVLANGKEFEGKFLMALMSNIHFYAVMRLVEDVCLDDGVMDLFLFKGETPLDAYQRLFDLFTGRHKESDSIVRIRFQELSLSSPSKLYLQMDGEPFDSDGDVRVRVAPKALRVIVPASAPAGSFLSPAVRYSSAHT